MVALSNLITSFWLDLVHSPLDLRRALYTVKGLKIPVLPFINSVLPT